MVFNQILNPILRPLLDSVGPFWTLFIVTVFVSLLTTLVYKYTTDQNRLKQLRADMKRYQKKLTANKDNPEKALKIQKDMMKLNGELMRQSLKSTLYTFIPILLFFGWMQANLAFAPLLPDQVFEVTVELQEGVQEPVTLFLPEGVTSSSNLTQIPDQGIVSWSVSGNIGAYDASTQVQEEEQFFSFIISENVEYVEPLTEVEDSNYISTITVGNQKLEVFANIPGLNAIPWVSGFNWFWAYFLLSIIFSMSLRKALGVA